MKSIFTVINFVVMWVVSMCWHLGRIGMGRPAYSKLADTGMTVVSFIIVYLSAGMARHVLINHMDVLATLLKLVAWAGVLAVFAETERFSSARVAALMGASAVVDLVCVAAALAHCDLDQSYVPVVLEFVLSVAAVVRFDQEPAAVRAAGYGRVTAED